MGHPHFEKDGKLLQADKKYSDLKQRQKEQITRWIEEAFSSYLSNHGKLPDKVGKAQIAGHVLLQMDKVGIWLPEGEAKRRCSAVISRLVRKYEAGKEPFLFRQSEYVTEYDKRNTQRVTLKLNKTTDSDIISYLDLMTNKQGYIKGLIRRDIGEHHETEGNDPVGKTE